MPVIKGRQTVDRSDGLVVVLIGARINKWWLLPLSLPILARMQAMQKELLADPESGLLAVQSLGLGGDVQYWRSVEHLLAYAADETREHEPTARRFYKKLFKNEAVGVWHEVYVLPPGHFECLYVNMPPQGLGKVGPLVPARGRLKTARGRLAALSRSRALASDKELVPC